MNYLEEIKNRSVFLWQSLFGEERSAGGDVPVYIDGAAAALHQAAAAQEMRPDGAEKTDAPKEEPERLQMQSAQEPAAPAAKTFTEDALEMEETVLRGIAEENAAALLQQTEAAAAQTARRHRAEVAMDAEAADRLPSVQWWPEEYDASAASAAAQTLLTQVQQAERSAAAARRETPVPALQERVAAAGQRAADPADWSLCFERDARRYDGAYELL